MSHGTDVWLGNAKDLIDSGTAKLPQCFCTRDDIMNFLISKGLENKMSFDIMESVRKGRGLTPDMEAAMLSHEVPGWAIDSCKKIKYMFPRGHAVAYVTMGLRVAWYKIYRPLAYYAAYFTIRADGFDAGTMILSNASLRERLNAFAARDEKLNAKEKQEQNALHMILEMQERGIRLLPVDLYKSDKNRFLPEEGDLRCPFLSLKRLYRGAADAILQSRDTPTFRWRICGCARIWARASPTCSARRARWADWRKPARWICSPCSADPRASGSPAAKRVYSLRERR